MTTAATELQDNKANYKSSRRDCRVSIANFNSSLGKGPKGRRKAGALCASRWKREILSFGDFSLDLLQRATDSCSKSTGSGVSVANFDSSHGKPPNGTAESGARENEPLETGTPFVRGLLARIVAMSNGFMQPQLRSLCFRC